MTTIYKPTKVTIRHEPQRSLPLENVNIRKSFLITYSRSIEESLIQISSSYVLKKKKKKKKKKKGI